MDNKLRKSVASVVTDDRDSEHECLRTNGNEREFPCEHETKDRTTNNCGNGLNDTETLMSVYRKNMRKWKAKNSRSQSGSSETVDLLGVGREAGSQ